MFQSIIAYTSSKIQYVKFGRVDRDTRRISIYVLIFFILQICFLCSTTTYYALFQIQGYWLYFPLILIYVGYKKEKRNLNIIFRQLGFLYCFTNSLKYRKNQTSKSTQSKNITFHQRFNSTHLTKIVAKSKPTGYFPGTCS